MKNPRLRRHSDATTSPKTMLTKGTPNTPSTTKTFKIDLLENVHTKTDTKSPA